MKAMRKVASYLLMPAIKSASRSYVAGDSVEDAILTCMGAAQHGLHTTIGYWNSDQDSVEVITEQCQQALKAINVKQLNSYLSVKAPALKFSQVAMKAIVNEALKYGVGIHFDAHGHEHADQTFDSVALAASQMPDVGCTLPGRWRRSLRDVDAALDMNVRVRVVKGQWADPETTDIDLRKGYLAVIDRLAGHARYVSVATHDPDLAKEALRRLRNAGTPCELELLYGLPMRGSMRVAKQCGVGARCYIPYGESWLPYALSQIKKNPKVLWWLLRDNLVGRRFG